MLIHAGGSGVGTSAVQLVRLAGGVPIVTAGSEAKLQLAKSLGAAAGFNYKEGNFSDKVLEFTKGMLFQKVSITKKKKDYKTSQRCKMK